MFTTGVIASLVALQESKFPEKPPEDRFVLYFLGFIVIAAIASIVLPAILGSKKKSIIHSNDSFGSGTDPIIEEYPDDNEESDSEARTSISERDLKELYRYHKDRRAEFGRELREMSSRSNYEVKIARGD